MSDLMEELEELVNYGDKPAAAVRDLLMPEIERLEARCLKLYDANDKQSERIAKLEAALREINSSELYNEAQMAVIAEQALANSEVVK